MDAAHYIRRHHRHNPGRQQCASVVVKHIKAPVDIVWSLVRRFDEPQKYKPFVSRCTMMHGEINIGSVREVNVKSGLPATTSTERLELLDDKEHILGIKIVGGDHRLKVFLDSPEIDEHAEIMRNPFDHLAQFWRLMFLYVLLDWFRIMDAYRRVRMAS
ncbi:hypothetical protein M8C21_004244 [Ambrosia artemisiifolia]|uniref:Uncharacterized protein n=1 Tax=Ambrosia artemisiifolia TaxID=4212 RepID=A0AAD5GAD5_AMBAR|nr:hypothetical protein M8C21_004244 [Ambrosia artemisiifolia]